MMLAKHRENAFVVGQRNEFQAKGSLMDPAKKMPGAYYSGSKT